MKAPKKTSRHLFVVDVGNHKESAHEAAECIGASFLYAENFYPKRVNAKSIFLGRFRVIPSKTLCLKQISQEFKDGKSVVVLGYFSLPDIEKEDTQKIGLKQRDVTHLYDKPYIDTAELQETMRQVLEEKANRKTLWGHIAGAYRSIKAGIKSLRHLDHDV